MGRTQCRGREHEQGGFGYGRAGHGEQNNHKSKKQSIPPAPALQGAHSSIQPRGWHRGMDPALTGDARHCQSSDIKEQTPSPSSNDFTSYEVNALGSLSV